MARKVPIQEITKGQVVLAADGDWWQVTATDINVRNKTVVLHTRHQNGKKGWVQGAIGDLRVIR